MSLRREFRVGRGFKNDKSEDTKQFNPNAAFNMSGLRQNTGLECAWRRR